MYQGMYAIKAIKILTHTEVKTDKGQRCPVLYLGIDLLGQGGLATLKFALLRC